MPQFCHTGGMLTRRRGRGRRAGARLRAGHRQRDLRAGPGSTPTLPRFRFAVCAEGPGPLRTSTGFTIMPTHGLAASHRRPDHRHRASPPVPPPSARPRAALRGPSAGCDGGGACTGAFRLAETGPARRAYGDDALGVRRELAPGFRRSPSTPTDLRGERPDRDQRRRLGGHRPVPAPAPRRTFGADVAGRMAREMVVPAHRSGGQSQFSRAPVPPPRTGPRPGRAARLDHDHLDERPVGGRARPPGRDVAAHVHPALPRGHRPRPRPGCATTGTPRRQLLERPTRDRRGRPALRLRQRRHPAETLSGYVGHPRRTGRLSAADRRLLVAARRPAGPPGRPITTPIVDPAPLTSGPAATTMVRDDQGQETTMATTISRRSVLAGAAAGVVGTTVGVGPASAVAGVGPSTGATPSAGATAATALTVVTGVTVIDAAGAPARPDRAGPRRPHPRRRYRPGCRCRTARGWSTAAGNSSSRASPTCTPHATEIDPTDPELYVVNGVTTTRQMSSSAPCGHWHQEIEAGTRLGPRWTVGSPIVDGAPSLWEGLGARYVAVADAAQARAACARTGRPVPSSSRPTPG